MAGLFGQRRPDSIGIMERIAMMGKAGQGGPLVADQIRSRRDADAARLAALQQAEARRVVEDRLRSQLSPMDGPNGSGTGAMPGIDQQMGALDEARLLNPEVADQFAPVVQERYRQQQAPSLFANDPRAQMLYRSGNQSFMDSLGEQYKPQVVAEGGLQSIAGENRQIRNPRTREFGMDLVRDTPTGVQTVATRGPTPTEQAALQNARTAQANAGFTLSPTQQRFGPDGQPIAQNTAPSPPNPAQVELQGAIDTNAREVIPTISQMRQMLSSGDVVTGFGAEARLQALRLAAAAGNEQARRQVAATEAYRNMSGRLRVGMAKTLGPNPSNADIQLLERVTAGDISQNQEALLATLDQGLTFAQQRAADLQRQLGQPQGAPQGQRAASGPRPRARNPRTGQVVEFDGSQWVPVQ